MIDLSSEELAEVKRLLASHIPEAEVRAFGSRVRGNARPYSDLDLALVTPEPVDWRRIEELKDAFAESNLPFMVDVLDWDKLAKEFQAIIEKYYEVLQEANMTLNHS